MEVLQMLSLFIAPSGVSDVGQQLYHFVLGSMDIESNKKCHENCFFQSIIGRGDFSTVTVYGEHEVAVVARSLRIIENSFSINVTVENTKQSIFSKFKEFFKRILKL
jgi:molybdopterin-synthase adenylyltransferase